MRKEQAAAVKAGIFVIVCLLVVILAIIALGQRTRLFGSEYTLVANFVNAGGLIRGAAVRVAGVNAGTVKTIQIVSGRDKRGSVRVVLEINTSFKPWIREGSTASVRTLGILGDKYVEITLGSFDRPQIKPGSDLATEESVDLYAVADQARQTIERANKIATDIADALGQVDKEALVQSLQGTTSSLRNVLQNVEKGPSLVHSLVYDPQLPKMLEDLQATTRVLRNAAESVQAGKGPLGQVLYGEQLTKTFEDFGNVTASAKAILKEVEQGNGVAHALVYSEEDRKALTELGQAIDRLNAIVGKIQDGQGTLGLLIADPSVWESLKRLFQGAEESRILKFVVERSVKNEK